MANNVQIQVTPNYFEESLSQYSTEQQRQFKQQESKYRQYFGSLYQKISTINYEKIDKESLMQHRMKILDPKDLNQKQLIHHGNTYIQYVGDQESGLVCTFDVVLGRFLLVVKLLNLHRSSEDEAQCIGSGSYGIVKKVDLGNKKFAIKKIKFQKKPRHSFFIPHLMDPDDASQKRQIRQAIKQYCIYKICSMLNIGPQVIHQNGYDLVCYNDCIEFFMELCQPIDKAPRDSYRQDLKLCVGTLHSLNFIHKDIKPPNILYSPSVQRYVLCDFGITHSIKQNFWEKTLTNFEGSYDYASEQMQKLFHSKAKGYINLYFNDLYSLDVTFDQLAKLEEEGQGSYEENSLSMMGSSSYELDESINSITIKANKQEALEENSETPHFSSTGQIQIDVSTSASTNLNFIKFSSEINFYQMKTIYEHLKLDNRAHDDIINVVYKVYKNQVVDENHQSITRVVTTLTQQILYPTHKFEKQIRKFRNSVRIFGIPSSETIAILEQFIESKSIPIIRHQDMRNFMNLLKKYEDFRGSIKSTEMLFIDKQRNSCLRNSRSSLTTIKQIMKQLLRKDPKNKQDETRIVLLAIQSLTLQDQTINQLNQIYYYLIKLCDKKNTMRKPKHLTRTQKLNIIKQAQQQYCPRQFNYEAWRNFSKAYRLLKDQQSYSRIYTLISAKRKQIQKLVLQNNVTKKQKKQFYNIFIQEITHYHLTNFDNMAQITVLDLKGLISHDMDISKQTYIEALDIITKVKLNQGNITQAIKYNQQSFKLKSELYFPKIEGTQFTVYYFYKGLIELNNSKYLEAIKMWEKCLRNLSSNLRSASKIQLIISCFNNIAYCYEKLGNFTQVQHYLQMDYYYITNTITYNWYKPQSTIQTLENLIINRLKLNKCDNSLNAYMDQLVYLKCSMFEDEEKQIMADDIRNNQINLQFVNSRRFKTEIKDKQILIFAFKAMVSSLQQKLPRFIRSYRNYCSYIFHYYESIGRINNCLQYMWRYFKHQSNKGQQYYQLTKYYTENLIKSQSSRRALLFIKSLIKTIPKQFSDHLTFYYKKLDILTHQLYTKDRKYYSLVWKNKSFKDCDSYNQTIKQIRFKNLKRYEELVWLKKLKMLKPDSNEQL